MCNSYVDFPLCTPTRYHSIDISRDCAQEIESPYNRSKDALMNDEHELPVFLSNPR